MKRTFSLALVAALAAAACSGGGDDAGDDASDDRPGRPTPPELTVERIVIETAAPAGESAAANAVVASEGGGGFMIVGEHQAGVGQTWQPALWTNTQANEWSHVSLPSEDGGWASGAAVAADGVRVVVGATHDGSGRTAAAAWSTAAGAAAWSRDTTLEPGRHPSSLGAIAADGDQFVAAGREVDGKGDGGLVVLVGAPGRWQPAEVPESGDVVGVAGIAVDGDAAVIVGTVDERDEGERPAAWWSADGGETWEEADTSDLRPGDSGGMGGVDVHEGRFYASVEARRSDLALLLAVSDDGRSWRAEGGPPVSLGVVDAEAGDVLVDADGIVHLAAADGESNDPVGFSNPDGEWTGFAPARPPGTVASGPPSFAAVSEGFVWVASGNGTVFADVDPAGPDGWVGGATGFPAPRTSGTVTDLVDLGSDLVALAEVYPVVFDVPGGFQFGPARAHAVSSDGRAFTPAPPDLVPDSGRFGDVEIAVGDGTALALANDVAPELAEISNLDVLAWRRGADERWEPLDRVITGPGHQEVFDLVHADGRWIAVGQSAPEPSRRDGDAAVWTSIDGGTWTEDDGDLGGERAQLADSVCAGPDGPVAVGQTGTPAGPRPVLWRSTSSGWQRMAADVLARREAQMFGCTAGDGVVVVVGHEDGDAHAWVVDGRTVQGVGLDGLGLASDVVRHGGAWLAAGSVHDGFNQDAALWWSPDARRWERIDHGRLGGPGQQRALAVTVAGDGVLIAGTDRGAGVVWRLDPAA